MKPFYFLRTLVFSDLLSAIPATDFTQAQPAQEYKPEVGQREKTSCGCQPRSAGWTNADLAKVTPKDYVIVWAPATAHR